MNTLVRIAAALVGVLIVGIAYVQALHTEATFPVGTDARAFINFQKSGMSESQVADELETLAAKHDLEFYQLSSPWQTLSLDVIVRGGPQPDASRSITWLQPGKTGTLHPKAEAPELPLDGMYALKGSAASLDAFNEWAVGNNITPLWEEIGPLTLFFAPLSYQGLGVTLLVGAAVFLSVLMAWFMARSEARAMRVLGGVPAARIQLEDISALSVLAFIPMAILTAVGIVAVAVMRGSGALVVLPYAVVLFVAALVGTVIFATAVGLATWPTVKQFAARAPMAQRFAWVVAAVQWAVMFVVLAGIPFAQLTLARTTDTERAATLAAGLPALHTANFGGIVDEAQDYEAKVPAFHRLAAELEERGQAAYAEYVPLDQDADADLRHIAIVNQQFMDLLTPLVPVDAFEPVPSDSVPATLREDILAAVGTEDASAVDDATFLAPTRTSDFIAVDELGLFSSLPDSLVVVLPEAAAALSADTITNAATRGALLFLDDIAVVNGASEIGVTLTTSNASEQIRLYAADQRLGLQVTIGSLVGLALTAAVLTYMASAIDAVRRERILFPRYLQGASWRSMIGGHALLDVLVILLGAAAGAILALVMEVSASVVIIGLAALALSALSLVTRRHCFHAAFRSIIQRKG